MTEQKELVKICEETWCIKGFGCHCYLVKDQDSYLMIDSGCYPNVHDFVKSQIGIDVDTVINTHSHFDHTGGNGFFLHVLMTEKGSKAAKNYMDEDPEQLRLDYSIEFIKDGDILGQGERQLRILECNCHAPGNIVLWDPKYRILFSGDEIDSDQVLLLPGYAEKRGQLHSCPAATVQHYLEIIEMIRKLPVTMILTGHNQTPVSPSFLSDMIDLCKQILQKPFGDKNCSGLTYHQGMNHYPYEDAGYLRATYKSATLVYNQYLIREEDLKIADKLPVATPLHRIAANSVDYIEQNEEKEDSHVDITGLY
jgi:glyoxylase-like metal-dependent hydrolase (beta-lactamase superfamily II)